MGFLFPSRIYLRILLQKASTIYTMTGEPKVRNEI